MPTRLVVLAALALSLAACQSAGSGADPAPINTNNVDRARAG